MKWAMLEPPDRRRQTDTLRDCMPRAVASHTVGRQDSGLRIRTARPSTLQTTSGVLFDAPVLVPVRYLCLATLTEACLDFIRGGAPAAGPDAPVGRCSRSSRPCPSSNFNRYDGICCTSCPSRTIVSSNRFHRLRRDRAAGACALLSNDLFPVVWLALRHSRGRSFPGISGSAARLTFARSFSRDRLHRSGTRPDPVARAWIGLAFVSVAGLTCVARSAAYHFALGLAFGRVLPALVRSRIESTCSRRSAVAVFRSFVSQRLFRGSGSC